MEKRVNKIVLAYSGGLDTSVAIKWLKEKYNTEIIAFYADIGQGENTESIREKALKTGASQIYIEDLKEEFVKRLYISNAQDKCSLRRLISARNINCKTSYC
jgi:argininosuccinate synthase